MVAFLRKLTDLTLLLPFVGAAIFAFLFFEDISWLAPIAGFIAGIAGVFVWQFLLWVFLPHKIRCEVTGCTRLDKGTAHSSYAEGVGRMHILGQK